MNANKLLTMAAACLVIAGCGGAETVPVADSGSGFDGADASNDGGAQTAGLGSGGGANFIGFEGELEGDAGLIQNDLIVYFEFDSSEIRPETGVHCKMPENRMISSRPHQKIGME